MRIAADSNLRLSPHELHYNLGYILQQRAELEQAAAHYRRAILLSRQVGDTKNCADAHHNLGVVLAQQECWLAATYHYRRSIALQQNVLAYCNLGTALLQQGETEGAIWVYQQAAGLPQHEATPTIWASLHHNLGQALQKQQHLSDAIAAYRQSLVIDPNRAQVHYNLGRAFHQQGNLIAATDCFQQALLLDSSLTVAQGDCAVTWLILGQFDRAMQHFQQAIAPHQPFITAYCNWIQALPPAEADEFTRARIACAQFLIALQQDEAEPDKLLVQALTHWANVLTEYGGNTQLRYAERLYQHALHLQPQQIDLYQRLAQCLIQQQRFAAAIVTYHLALVIAPQDPAIYTELGHLLQQQQQWLQALHYYRQAMRLRKGELIELGNQPPSSTATLPVSSTDSQPANPEAAKFCEGLNCEPCLQKMTQWFEPVRLGEGIYQLSHRSQALMAETTSKRAVTAIANGRIWVAPQTSAWQACSAIAVFSATGELIPHLSRSYPGQLPICQHLNVPLQGVPAQLPEPLLVKGKVAVLSSLSGSVYFHWMTDLLPRLEILQQQIDLQQIDYFLVNSYQRSFQQETLQAFGIESDKIIESDHHPYVQAEQLMVSEFASDLGWVQPWAIEFLRSKFLSKNHLDFSQNSGSRGYSDLQREFVYSLELDALNPSEVLPYIYLSRTDARYRCLLNEDAVLDYLRPRGFVSLELDSLSVSQQATLFANARVVVAPHGSSLTNLVFCQPGTQVIELISPSYLRHYFWRISQLLNLKHYVVWGEAFSCQFLRRLMYPNPLLEDIWIDIDRLHQVMQEILD